MKSFVVREINDSFIFVAVTYSWLPGQSSARSNRFHQKIKRKINIDPWPGKKENANERRSGGVEALASHSDELNGPSNFHCFR
jgi:hypothetical protein